MKFPKVIYITRDSVCDDEDLLAWTTISSADVGKVAIYELREVVEKRESTELRRERTKKWFKPVA